MRLKSVIFCLAGLCTYLSNAQKSVDIRMDVPYYDAGSNILYVDLLIKYDGLGTIHLGDQNYRIYYDSGNLRLQEDHNQLDLPKKKYSDVHWLEKIEGSRASHIGQLDFDYDLGFVNLSVDLLDDLNGGIKISADDGWKRILQLKYKVINETEVCQAIWSHRGKTDAYATAFVEILEWVGPNHEKPLRVEEAYDLSFLPETEPDHLDISIGPNPAMEYLKIEFGEFAQHNGHLTITNSLGERIIAHKKSRGTSEAILELSELVSATYNIELFDEWDQPVYKESFVVVR